MRVHALLYAHSQGDASQVAAQTVACGCSQLVTLPASQCSLLEVALIARQSRASQPLGGKAQLSLWLLDTDLRCGGKQIWTGTQEAATAMAAL
jgi:hypothetical protein